MRRLLLVLVFVMLTPGAARAQEEQPAADSSVAPLTYLYGDEAAIRSQGVAQVRRRIARIGAPPLVRRRIAGIAAPARVQRVAYTTIIVMPPQGASAQGAAVSAQRSSPSGAAPTATDVARALLETGLFRTVDVVFRFDRSTLLPASENVLNAVGDVMVNYPQLRIEVSGHTDDVGAEAYNLQLSEARAGAVRQYLLDHFPLAPDRLTARGFGAAQPVANNADPTGRALNRRVEFRVIN